MEVIVPLVGPLVVMMVVFMVSERIMHGLAMLKDFAVDFVNAQVY
jgi:hypothetical protein